MTDDAERAEQVKQTCTNALLALADWVVYSPNNPEKVASIKDKLGSSPEAFKKLKPKLDAAHSSQQLQTLKNSINTLKVVVCSN